VRSVPRAAARIGESAAMGFTRAIVPPSAGEASGGEARGLELVPVRSVEEAIARVLE
jgi:predicted ATP-dependent serine protease